MTRAVALKDHAIAATAVYSGGVIEGMPYRTFVDIAEANTGGRAFVSAAGTAGAPGSVTTAPPVKLISLAVMARAQSDAAKAAILATSS